VWQNNIQPVKCASYIIQTLSWRRPLAISGIAGKWMCICRIEKVNVRNARMLTSASSKMIVASRLGKLLHPRTAWTSLWSRAGHTQ